MAEIARQLDMLGLEETRRRVAMQAVTPTERARLERRVETAHQIMSELPGPDDLSFLHSGMCQTALPHHRPSDDSAVWERRSGRFSLLVQPGMIDRLEPGHTERRAVNVGVPFGPKARLILIYLQTEGLRSRTVHLGSSLSAFLRSLGLSATGGERGTITAVREQALRIARCRFTMQWTEDAADGRSRTLIRDTQIVNDMEMLRAGGEEWTEQVELTEAFHSQLKDHAVPLDKRAIASLSANSLGLDLYTLFAYRLPRLSAPLQLRWKHLQAQIGAGQKEPQGLARRVRDVMPAVTAAYPQARVEVTSAGIILRPSKSPIPSIR